MTTNNALISRSAIDRIIRCNAHAGRASRIKNDRPQALAAAMLRDEDQQAAQIPFDGFYNSCLTAAFDEGIAHELEWRIEEADYRDCSLTRDELEDCAGDCCISRWFSFSSLDGRDPETLSRLICSAAAYLDRDDSDDEDEDDGDCAFDPLGLDVFKSEGGDFIIDADLAVGGPTIRARYESRWNTLEISASWGSDTVRIYQDRGESSYLKDRLAAFGEL